ncbi:MAG: hypothetical protein ACKN9E_02985 [Microcystaceae cyanobacterium]
MKVLKRSEQSIQEKRRSLSLYDRIYRYGTNYNPTFLLLIWFKAIALKLFKV